MREKRDAVNQAVLNLIRASNPKDEIFVVNFSQNSYLDQDFTSDVNLLQAALHQVSARGSTALYDAIVASSVHLRNNSDLTKKVLLVITDGQDNMSAQTLQEEMCIRDRCSLRPTAGTKWIALRRRHRRKEVRPDRPRWAGLFRSCSCCRLLCRRRNRGRPRPGPASG